MAVISKGITLSYKQASSSGEVVLKGLQSVAELGGTVESIEITTLSDEAHVYEKGIKNYGDSLDFTFLYDDGAEFFKLQGITDEVEWSVKLPDGAKCTFNGGCSVKLDSVGVNSALTFTLSIKPSSAMVWTQHE